MAKTTLKPAPSQARLLVVDDDPDVLSLLTRWFEKAGFPVTTATNGMEALTQFQIARPDVIITDFVMDKMDGLKLLREIHRHDPVMPVVMLSGEAGVADAIAAAHLGVSAFLTKPVNREEILGEIDKVLRWAGISSTSEPRDAFASDMVYRSAAMAGIIDRARLVAATDTTVLITGDTGTGKEVLAKAIHQGSSRRDKPFVSVNCSAIPEQLLESELFGHEKGAFTGALARHEGLFRAADEGTLFLDEVGDMPLALQAKLLRVLQDFQVRPVGSTTSVPVDVRILSATHQDLEQAVEGGEFREDLYYRLSVVPLRMPSLSERREDIPLLADHFLNLYAESKGIERRYLAPSAQDYLVQASWPGNIRQLSNVIEQCIVLCSSDVIPLDMIKGALRERPGDILPFEEAKRDFERRYLIGVLRIAGGNVSNAARLAGRNRTEFYKLLNRHELDAAQFRDDAKASPNDDIQSGR